MPVITQSFGKVTILSERVFFESLSLSIGYNVLRAGDRNPVLRLRQGYGACTLLCVVFSFESNKVICKVINS